MPASYLLTACFSDQACAEQDGRRTGWSCNDWLPHDVPTGIDPRRRWTADEEALLVLVTMLAVGMLATPALAQTLIVQVPIAVHYSSGTVDSRYVTGTVTRFATDATGQLVAVVEVDNTVTGTTDVVELPVLDISARCVASDATVTTEAARVNNPTPDISFIEYGGITIPLSSVDKNSAKAICTLADQVASNSPPTKLAKTLNNILLA